MGTTPSSRILTPRFLIRATPNAFDHVTSGDSVTTGFEGEANIYITHGLSFYANGTAGKAHYVNTGLWVANTPSNTEAFGLTYHQKHGDFGIFDKRVGP